ncbi:MAG: protein BatD, partial [Chloroflexi bacterium]|nr:protein BatD [Chloroflexota bacterium]
MKHWNMVLVLVALLLLPAMPAGVFAQDGAALSLSLSADKSSAAVGENITYTYLISSTGNVT